MVFCLGALLYNNFLHRCKTYCIATCALEPQAIRDLLVKGVAIPGLGV